MNPCEKSRSSVSFMLNSYSRQVHCDYGWAMSMPSADTDERWRHGKLGSNEWRAISTRYL